MNIKKIILLFIIICNIQIHAKTNPETKVIDFFDKQGFLNKTFNIYHTNNILTSIEKAEIFSEIMNNLFYEKKKYNITMDILKELKEITIKYYTDIALLGSIHPEIALKKIHLLMLNKRDILHGYTPDLKIGIKAKEVLKNKKISSAVINQDGSYNTQNREYLIKDGNIKIKDIIGFELSGKSYFSLYSGFLEPDTNLSYADSSTFAGWNLGFNKNSKISFDIRSLKYSAKSTGIFFNPYNENYKLEINPVSFSLKMYLFKIKKLIPYTGYGITQMKYKHTRGSEISTEKFWVPNLFYGIEFFEKDSFSIFGDINYFLIDEKKLKINNSYYNINMDKLFITFGVKFYFRG